MIEVDFLNPKQWARYSEDAHRACFGEYKPAEWDRIDFALVTRRDKTLLGYLTCREFDAKTLYWQFGGAFPGTRETTLSFQCYLAYVKYSKERYKRVVTLIENTNAAMLKMALKVGFLVTGLRVFNGQILLECLLEFP